MKSPVTGKEMNMLTRKEKLAFRGEEFEFDYTYLLCLDSNREFITPEMGDTNLRQVYDQYNAKHGTSISPD